MNKANCDFLFKSLLSAGFPNSLRLAFHERMSLALPAFLLPCKASFDKQQLEATIYIRKWQDCPLYYLHKYHATQRAGTNDPPISQDFFFARMHPVITLPEAGRLLSGQPVYRDSCRYKDRTYMNCWLRLDLTQTDIRGNFLWVIEHQSKIVST